eukprot:CAMPEP_0206319636 /NCGR_PEP_ID=MMETSP0106_2-20121207/17866_1 /ASSEMBLY_ACC=CAM_ASM_000206 /TAXON_ID=81532 /ORGANISM="Acanthoeca-like sp., Strain 10tr" /LENGTH=307 /DNA_ID=CAMNT_0053751491 /DNA_START=100 /DNA_END=1019 /DNA_ORIENTATION=-
MEAEKGAVFARFVTAMQLHESTDPGTCAAYLEVIALAAAVCQRHAAAGEALDDPSVTQLLTIAENASIAARKALSFASTGTTPAAAAAVAPDFGGDVTPAPPPSSSGAGAPPSAAAVGGPSQTSTPSHVLLSLDDLPPAPPTALPPGGRRSTGPSPVSPMSRRQSPRPPSGALPGSIIPDGLPMPQGPIPDAPTNNASPEMPQQQSLSSSSALSPPPAGQQSPQVSNTASRTTQQAPVRNFVAEAQRENRRLRLLYERQQMTHKNPEMLRIRLHRDMAANTQYAQTRQAALERQLEEQRAKAKEQEL